MYQEATQRVGRASVLESPLRSARASAAAAAAASRAAEEQHTVRAAGAAADPGKAADAVSYNPEKPFHDLLSAAIGHACRLNHFEQPQILRNLPACNTGMPCWDMIPQWRCPELVGWVLILFSLHSHFILTVLLT